ncbi:uncharacterized protein LOC131882388 [Tigriopus californicus]|uniref:uncharacterized protein LOC131882388 n=1 Tax=Tigriopus californicus TaxID=6832 RepID=UPI0027DA5728|nr:uncharacterized protein LOC131882388 [Tigriopus californicus]
MESSDHISTSNFPYMVAYLEPRCFNSDGTTVSAVEEVCAGLELPSEDVVFRIEKDSKIVFEKDGAGEACGFDCERNPSCKMWARFTEKDTCRMWGDSPGPTVTPKCVLDSIPGKAYSTVTHYQLKHKKLITEENAAVYGVDDTNKCWNICAKNPLCQELAIHESRCYIFQGSSQFDSPDPTFSEDFLSLKLKFYGT